MELTNLVNRTNDAKKRLLELFLVSDEEFASFRPLNVAINAEKCTSYNSVTTTFNYNEPREGEANPEEDLDNPLVSIGEEVSHYIHNQLNSCVWKNIPMDKLGLHRFIMEFVAHYGMLSLFGNLKKPIPNIPILKQIPITEDPVEFEMLLGHKIGYEYAHECFKRQGATKLPMFARMPVLLVEPHLHRLAPISWIHKTFLPLYDKITRSPYRDLFNE